MDDHDPLEGEFKQAMRRLASTVAIVTASRDGAPCGMVATAVNSVSTEPPSLVISINRLGAIHGAITTSRRFCVNILSPFDNALIPAFSGQAKGEARFAFGDWIRTGLGPPRLRTATASLVCVVEAELDYASHTLFVGRVEVIRLAGEAEPLLWHNGQGASPQPLSARPAA